MLADPSNGEARKCCTVLSIGMASLIAFILARVESGKDREVLDQIKKLGEAKRVPPTYGTSDLIVEFEFGSSKELDSFVFDKIRKIDGSRVTATLTCSEMLIWELCLQ